VLLRTDLVEVSKSLNRPWFTNVWNDVALRRTVLITHESTAGAGFGILDLSSGGLGPHATSVLVYLSAADRVASGLASRTDAKDFVRDVISDAHHRLMSLVPWSALAIEDQADIIEAVYETSRLTAILYSNSVLLHVPTGSGWHIKLLRQIRRTLSVLDNHGRYDSLLVWSLMIASIAAHDTEECAYFNQRLRSVLADSGSSSWECVAATLCQFVWSDEAGEAAGRMIFDDVTQ
jgi:hypothetical protein